MTTDIRKLYLKTPTEALNVTKTIRQCSSRAEGAGPWAFFYLMCRVTGPLQQPQPTQPALPASECGRGLYWHHFKGAGVGALSKRYRAIPGGGECEFKYLTLHSFPLQLSVTPSLHPVLSATQAYCDCFKQIQTSQSVFFFAQYHNHNVQLLKHVVVSLTAVKIWRSSFSRLQTIWLALPFLWRGQSPTWLSF